ncbi:MAG: hypothetical protein HON66_02540 [Formosa sp.]|jgi:hypothetical protein|nr:hypothetical protein [Formosa sp.]MDA9640292.1 hypothetical protein [Flavobacteriaceae bacterium]MDB2426736.1 hypothetical protein [Flavobacteriaceae bacterium]MDC3351171.1 hypothetical protein [Flavobacteriaceae bacterium]|tara:strand:+ start:1195 stop:2760 length:1566 start_codon:yes stop_codon:yes gene_type:complete
MKRFLYVILSLITLVFWSSCRQDFIFHPSSDNLSFSKDTVYLDTIFSNIGSSTYTLKVYNQSNKDILIPSIKLSKGQNSNYRMNVDGLIGNSTFVGKEFENIEILARDSMYVFIETTIDILSLVGNETHFLYTDAIEFENTSGIQKVELVTLVKDAIFIYPDRDTDGITESLYFDIDGDGISDETSIRGRFLEDSELNFTNEKPYVIYGYAAVGDGKTLNINPGARIHFHADSGLLITDNASLHVNGLPSLDSDLLENEVIFEGDRLEPLYEDIPGQWQTIWLYNGSVDNVINYATIKNGTIGVLSDGNELDPSKFQITNSQVYNHSNFGILGRATSIVAENLVINNCGLSSFAGTFGGNYNITHSTIVNYWSSSFRQFPALLLNNFIVDIENEVTTNPMITANFTNCIIYGNNNPELLIEKEISEGLNFKFTNSLIYFDDLNGNFTSAEYDFSNSTTYENVIFNNDPLFLDPNNNRLTIPVGSPAQGAGIIYGNTNKDITNTLRNQPPDIGAYNAIEFDD